MGTGREHFAQKAARVVLGWGTAGWALFGPIPYAIPWWGRFLVALFFVSIAHSTVTGIVLKNVAASGPAIIGLVRGVVADRRDVSKSPRLSGASTDITQPKLPNRRKSDAVKKP